MPSNFLAMAATSSENSLLPRRPKPDRKPGTRLGIACGKFRANRFDGGDQALAIGAHAFGCKDGIQLAAHAGSVQVQVHQDAVQAHNGNASRPSHCPGKSSQWGDMGRSLLQIHNNETTKGATTSRRNFGKVVRLGE